MNPRCRSVSSTAATTGTTRSAASASGSSSPASTSTQNPSRALTGASHTLPSGVGTGPALARDRRAPAGIGAASGHLEPPAVVAPEAHPSLDERAETLEHRTEPP